MATGSRTGGPMQHGCGCRMGAVVAWVQLSHECGRRMGAVVARAQLPHRDAHHT